METSVNVNFAEAQESDFEIEPGGGDKTAVITGYRGVGGGIVIPAMIGGRRVTGIGESAFNGSFVTGAVIPFGVTSIGKYAFCGCSGLASVTIPDSVAEIGKFAFCGCSGLTSVTIPVSVAEIGKFAFCDCGNLASVTIGNCGISFDNVFADCPSLASVTILDGVASIRDAAFDGCAGLTSVIIGGGVTTIGKDAFSGCMGLTSITIPGGVSAVGERAFHECHGLRSVLISDGVTSIGEGAFYKCAGLTSVTIPASVVAIGEFAFSHCAGLAAVTCLSPTPPETGGNAFGYIDMNKIDLNVPENSIDAYRGSAGWSEFRRVNGREYSAKTKVWHVGADRKSDVTCTLKENGTMTVSGAGPMENYGLGDDSSDAPWYDVRDAVTSIVIEDGVTTVGDNAFNGCAGLMSLTIAESVVSIEKFAFYRCVGLTSVIIPGGVTSVKYMAFASCIGLRSITIGRGVTDINLLAFDDCRNLRHIDVAEDNVKYSSLDGALFNKNKTTLVLYPADKDAYSIPDGVASIGSNAFAFGSCYRLTSVAIPNSVTEIGEKAFCGCTGLTSVIIPDGVTCIEDYTFANCVSLKSVIIGSGVDTIEELAFDGCTGLTSVTCRNPIPPETDWNLFGSVNMDAAALYVPEGSVDSYRSAEGWRSFKTIIILT